MLTLAFNVEPVSAAVSPYIAVVPESTVDLTLTPGMNYTVSIYTDYSGDDVWGWQFELFFNPAVLEGVEVCNGDLITEAKDPRARFHFGDFNNTLGHLRLTVGYFYPLPMPPPTTNGPGTLAYVTFRVKDTGISNITFGRAQLKGFDNVTETFSDIIDQDGPPGATEPPYGVDHISHGSFDNIPPVHDVAVAKIVAPATAILGENVTIDVTVANKGNYTETFDVAVTANSTQIETQTVTNLVRGARIIRTFTWSTTGITAGNYTLNATALITDDDMCDNSRTATIEIKTAHDVAIIDLQIPSQATIGEHVAINVTVANRGSYEENANLTVYYESIIPGSVPHVINTTSFTIAKLPSIKIISMNWNTTGLVSGYFKINATVTIDQDEDLSGNTWTQYCELRFAHDVAIVSISASPDTVFVGELIEIEVNLRNSGANNETFEVKVTYDTSDIDTKLVESMPPDTLTSLRFIWNTTGVTPASYKITAEAMLATDVNPTNNKRTASAFIEPPLRATIDIDPDTLNLYSEGEWITCYVELPEGYNVSDIDIYSVKLNDTFPVSLLPDPPVPVPTEIGDYDNDTIPDLIVKFNRTEIASWIYNDLGIQYGDVTLMITGELSDGTPFEGTVVVRVLFPGDVDGDGYVGSADAGVLTRAYGTSSGDPLYVPEADFDEDGYIGSADAGILSGNYGKTAT